MRRLLHDCAPAGFVPHCPKQRPQGATGETALFSGARGERTMDAQASQTRRAVSAAVIGNVLEWYDFAVYAFVAGYLARKFFPPGDEVTALLSTFLAYGLGFVARPLGGIILGRLGDTHGRKTALLITIALMAIGTVLIGILPTYAAIG